MTFNHNFLKVEALGLTTAAPRRVSRGETPCVRGHRRALEVIVVVHSSDVAVADTTDVANVPHAIVASVPSDSSDSGTSWRWRGESIPTN